MSRARDIANFITGQTAASEVDPDADYAVIYDASAGAYRKVLIEKITDEGQLALLEETMF